MAESKCPCGLRNYMEEEDCKMTNCNDCCPLTKPRTNGDRFRAMSDEELSLMFYRMCINTEFCDECPVVNNCPGVSARRWEEWLKQPAEVE